MTMSVNESRHMRIIWCLRVKIIRPLREQEMFSMQSASEVTDLFLKLCLLFVKRNKKFMSAFRRGSSFCLFYVGIQKITN